MIFEFQAKAFSFLGDADVQGNILRIVLERADISRGEGLQRNLFVSLLVKHDVKFNTVHRQSVAPRQG